jgi:hypothetical protein
MGIVDFGEKTARWGGKDWRHNAGWMWNEQPSMNRGRGLVVQASKNEFYLVGVNYRLFLRRKPTLDKMGAPLLVSDWATKIFGYIVSVDEGTSTAKVNSSPIGGVMVMRSSAAVCGSNRILAFSA